MDLYTFASGPLLWAVFSIFSVCVLVRLVFFTVAVIRSPKLVKSGCMSQILSFFRVFIPFHIGLLKRPIYAPLRYIFHICLIIVPVWFSGHISLWEESRLQWAWTAMPSGLADMMTMLVLTLAVFFLMRRIIIKEVRRNSGIMDFIVLLITAMPFLSGWFLTHGGLDSVAFLSDNILYIHIFTSCAMILMAGFLFCRTRMIETRCVGCTACEQSCPTGTIEYQDQGHQRIFNYSHYQCICCAACVRTCPEKAAELRHELSFKRFFQILSKHVIRMAEMQACERCGALFAPQPQMQKMTKIFTHHEYLRFCQNCRKINVAGVYKRINPWHPVRSEIKSQSDSIKRQIP